VRGRGRQRAGARRQPQPLLRGDREAGGRKDALEDQHQRIAAPLIDMSVTLKSSEDIARMREAGRLAGELLDYPTPHVQAGVTTGEIDRLAHDYMVNEQRTIPATLNYAPPGHT